MPEGKERVAEIENKTKVLVIGTFRENDIQIDQHNRELIKTPEIAELISQGWIGKEGWRSEPLLRLESFELQPNGVLKLTTGETNYKEYVGTRSLQVLRRYGYDRISNPISTSAVLITTDNKMLIAQKKQGDAVGSVDAIGGYINLNMDAGYDGKINVFNAAKRELQEETGVTPNDLEDFVCLGLSYEYTNLCHPVLSFAAKINLKSKVLQERKPEEIQIIAVNPERIPNQNLDNIEYVMDLLRKTYPNVEPDGRITMALTRKWMESKTYPKRVMRTIDRV